MPRHTATPAQVDLAVTYANGWGVSRSYGAASTGSTLPQNRITRRLRQSWHPLYERLGVRRDYAEAFKDLEIAARAGDAGPIKP
jgi:hypothetical protein